jgi:hypothetical protein
MQTHDEKWSEGKFQSKLLFIIARDGAVFFSAVSGIIFLLSAYLSYESAYLLPSYSVRPSDYFAVANQQIAAPILVALGYFAFCYFCIREPTREVFLYSLVYSGFLAVMYFSLQVISQNNPSLMDTLSFFNGYQLVSGLIEIIVVFFSFEAFRSLARTR